MPSAHPRVILTDRDRALLGAVALCPLTARQLCRLSATFPQPFATEHRLRQRLRQLVGIGLLRRHPYATTGPGTLHYYLLTRDAFRFLFGPNTPLPRWGWFQPISRAGEVHTHVLGDVLTHSVVCAHRDGIELSNVHRENALRLEAGGEAFKPDGAFDLVTPGERTYSFFLEVDNGTEPLRSQTERNSLERKIRQYEAYADRAGQRFRVLFVTTGGLARVQHVLGLASAIARNPDRSLFYGITVAGFLDLPSLHAAHLLNHRGERVALVEEHPALPLAASP